MKEYLIIGNSQYIYRIESSEIWYITPGKHNCSEFFLTSGKHFDVPLPLCEIKKKLDKYLRETHKKFRCIGEGLIINMDYLFMINKSEREIVLLNRRSDGFMDGYSAGISDAESNNKPVSIKLKSNTVNPSVSERAIKELHDEFKPKKG